MPVRTLLFTDVVDSTQLVERLGDAAAAALWAEHDRRARGLMAAHGAREIDRTDGFFLLFDAPHDAARFALAYHRALREIDLQARVGVHLGEVTLRENAAHDIARGAKPVEVEGLAKPFAARVMALAGASQTLLSASAREALAAAPGEGAAIESHGHYRLKGVEEPVELFELGPRDGCAFAPPADADKAYRVVRAGEVWLPLREVRHNLPAERDAFVGRTAELRALAHRLDGGARLVTVLGPGGIGKTRLVVRYGRAWLGDWPGGVYFCDLAEARSLDAVFSAVAVALGVPLGRSDPAVHLGHVIDGRGRCLVILDNFEQVAAHASAALGRWIDRAAGAGFIVTSRQRIHLPGEQVFPVEPLPLLDDAVELFALRACAQQPEFAIDASNRGTVAEVVRLLDGLPLAIELAAARVRVLSPGQLVERMRDRFALLVGARGPAARQATLRAAIDWSWDLLAPWEQAALAQSSVFDGGFTLKSAEAVLDLARWPDAPSTLDVIQSLVDKSLLRSDAGRFDIEEPHFGMYISIHEYAAARLTAMAPGADRHMQRRHARHYGECGRDAALDALYRHGGTRLRRALALEIGNLVTACRRAAASGEGELAVAAWRAAWEVLELQGPYALGVALGGGVLTLDGVDPSQRAAAALALGTALRFVGRTDDAGRCYEQAIGWAREAGDRRRESTARASLGTLHHALGRLDHARGELEAALEAACTGGHRREEGNIRGNLANLYSDEGAMDVARAYYEDALAIHREVGNRRAEGAVLGNLGILHAELGDVARARAHYEASMVVHAEVGNESVRGIVLSNHGALLFDQGHLDEALAAHQAALSIHREVGNRRFEALVLNNLGTLADEQGRVDEALAFYEQALAINREVGNRRSEASVLCNLGALHLQQGRLEMARRCCEPALATARDLGSDRLLAQALGNTGDLLRHEGRVAEARDALVEAESLMRGVGERLELAKTLCIRGHIELAAGDRGLARAILAEVESAAADLGVDTRSELAREMARLRQALE